MTDSAQDDRFCEHGNPIGTRCPQCEGPPAPAPDFSLRNVFDLITPPGTDGGKLLDALKGSQRAAGPADPFTPGSMAAAATAEFFHDLVKAGIPVKSVEGIIGNMLAASVQNKEGE